MLAPAKNRCRSSRASPWEGPEEGQERAIFPVGRMPVAQLMFHWVLKGEMRAWMPSGCEEHLQAWPSGHSLRRMGLEELGLWASRNEPRAVGCLVPPAEEVLRNQGDKLTHSEDANGPLSPAAPMPAQRVHGHRDMEAKMESPARSPSQGSSNTTLTSAAERSAEPQHDHPPWGTKLFSIEDGKVSQPPWNTHLSG